MDPPARHAAQEHPDVKLRIVTATRGDSPHWNDAVAAIAAVTSAVDHVVVCPADRIAALAFAAPKARFVAESGRGLYPALNQGLREPGGWDAFTWLNDDDLLVMPGFDALIDHLRQQPELAVAYGRVTLIDSHNATIGELPVARRGRDLPALLARSTVPFAQPGTVLRRDLCEKLVGFDETLQVAADLDLFARALASGAEFGFVPAHVAAFRLRAGQLSKRSSDVEAETRRALSVLAHVRPSAVAMWRFRLGNLGAYVRRLRTHGWISMRELYDSTR